MKLEFEKIGKCRYKMLTVKGFIAERGLKVTTSAINRAIREGRVDFTMIDGVTFVLLTPRTERAYPIGYSFLMTKR